MCYPSDFSSKPLNVILLPLENVLRYKQRKRAVPDTHFLDLVIEPILYGFPHEVRGGLPRR